ncbi:MAG: response regulator transcription factor [Flavobacterium sp.]
MKQTIVVVEDELLIALDIKEILEEEGYEVIINVTSVDKAITIIEENAPILVLIDINLKQDKDGIELGEYLLIQDKMPYIYLTSYHDKLTLDRAKDTRPHGYIVKPFKAIDLITTISITLNNFKHNKIDPRRNQEEVTNNIPFKIKETITYINNHVYDKIEISELSALTPWKKNHFIRMFTKYVGETPYQYILKRKIKKAEALLAETNQPINEIALDLSFQSYSNFFIAFKKMNQNQTPENYRLKSQANSNI